MQLVLKVVLCFIGTHISGCWMLDITNTGSIETRGWYSSANENNDKIHCHHEYYDSKQNPVFRYLQGNIMDYA